jgi:Na+-transporting NADH:ubiquinone oxidoreductase subunit A
MAEITITRGLDIPIAGRPEGKIQDLGVKAEGKFITKPKLIALNLDPFEGVRFKLLVKEGDAVKIGQPLVEDKLSAGRVFASPAAGVIQEVRRGLKRRLLDIVIQVDEKETYQEFSPLNPSGASR